jgi:prepilin-type processing-associated H-X9-DG protein
MRAGINFGNENLSYFLALDADETRPEMILAGDRTFTTNGRIVSGVITVSRGTEVAFAPGIHRGYGNIALADGSAQRMEHQDLSSQALRSTVSPFRVQIP